MTEFNGELKAYKVAAEELAEFRKANPQLAGLEENLESTLNALKAKAKAIAAKSGPFDKVHNGVSIRVDQRQADKFANVKSMANEEIELLNSFACLKVDPTNYNAALKFGALDAIDSKVRVEGHTFAASIKYLGGE